MILLQANRLVDIMVGIIKLTGKTKPVGEMEEMIKMRKFSYGANTFIFKCNEFEKDGTWLDTVVMLNEQYFCTIIGANVDSFIDDFKVFLIKYKI
jgi:hypothetical protein